MPISTLTSKGQVTVPKTIRERLDLRAGDRLEFSIDDAGQIVARPGRQDRHDRGIFGVLRDFAHPKPVTVEEMNQAIRERAAASLSRRS